LYLPMGWRRVAAYGGLRAGELHALEVHDIDTMRGRIHDELVVHLVPVADHPDALAFTTAAGAPIRQSNFYRRHFRPTADAIGLRRTFHDLRHFCVASLIAAGAPSESDHGTHGALLEFSEAAADALRPTRPGGAVSERHRDVRKGPLTCCCILVGLRVCESG
jgi:integrase